jgi:hypothetical protein
MSRTKPWYLSRTVITSGVAFGVALASAAGLLDAEAATKIEALLIPLILTFLRLGDATLE